MFARDEDLDDFAEPGTEPEGSRAGSLPCSVLSSGVGAEDGLAWPDPIIHGECRAEVGSTVAFEKAFIDRNCEGLTFRPALKSAGSRLFGMPLLKRLVSLPRAVRRAGSSIVACRCADCCCCCASANATFAFAACNA